MRYIEGDLDDEELILAHLEDEDYYYDPYENMTKEEIEAKMPPYWNKSRKYKKRFFKKLN